MFTQKIYPVYEKKFILKRMLHFEKPETVVRNS